MFFSMYADFIPVGVNGAIHIGAGDAPELDVYASLDIPCIWIDANRQAIDNLKDLPTHNTIHRFHHAFISDKTQKDSFFPSKENPRYSSKFGFNQISNVFADAQQGEMIEVDALTLRDFANANQIDLQRYNYLILDTCGSEYLILNQSVDILEKFDFIRVSCPDFSAYHWSPTVSEVFSLLTKFEYELLPPVIVTPSIRVDTKKKTIKVSRQPCQEISCFFEQAGYTIKVDGNTANAGVYFDLIFKKRSLPTLTPPTRRIKA